MKWNMISTGDIALRKGGSVDPKKHQDEVFELYSIPAFDAGAPEVVAGSAIGSSKKAVQPNDVMISRIVPHIRRACVVGPANGHRQIASGEWIIFRDERIWPKYLRWLLVGDVFHSAFMRTVSGVGGSLLRARPAEVFKIQIPLPPLAEQKRIAGILDAADALRAKRREALAQLDTLLQSTFLDMFGDPVTNPMGWEVRELGEVAGFHAGSTLPAGEDFVGQDGGFLYLKVGDLNHILNKEAVVRSNIWGKEAKKGITAPKDAVVIPKRGGAIGTNKKRLLSRKSVLDPNLMAISGSESLHHVYLHRWFHTFDLMSITSGSTVPQLNKRDLAPLRIPLPPVDLQHRFAAVVESVERQRASQRAHLAELDTLFASLQSRAFRGDL